MLKIRVTLFALMTVLVTTSHPPTAHAETLTFVADQWCPYNCEPDTEKPGYIIDILNRAFSKHGHTIKYTNVPWTRAIEEVGAGKYTGIIGTSHTNTPDFIFPSVPQGKAQTNFYVRNDSNWRYDGVASLEKVSLGVIADYLYMDELDKYIAQNKEDPARVQIVSGDDALEKNLRKLVSGRITTTLEESFVVDYFLLMNPDMKPQVINAGALTGEDSGLFVAFSPSNKKSSEYAKILSDEMSNMRKNGEIAEILARYGLTDWEAIDSTTKTLTTEEPQP